MEPLRDPRQWGAPIMMILEEADLAKIPQDFLSYGDDDPQRPACPEYPDTCDPNPVSNPLHCPPGRTLPEGLSFTLKNDNRYYLGCTYSTTYKIPFNVVEEKHRLAALTCPYGTAPGPWDAARQKYEMFPIDGMTRMLPGIPYVLDLDGDPDFSMTGATLFTIESLRMFQKQWPEISLHLNRLWDATWGEPNGPPAIFDINLKRNDRAAPPDPQRPSDGSFSLASTSLNQGSGIAVPAHQPRTTVSIAVRLCVLQALHGLVRIILKLALSKQEYEAIIFMALQCNIFSAGGLEPTGLTSVQCNISSLYDGGELGLALGMLQGSWHVDMHDDPARWTVLVVLLKLPPGSDPGAFLLGRLGLYVRAEVHVTADGSGMVCYFLVFKGNDMHTGVAPTLSPDDIKKCIIFIANNSMFPGVNRVVYVNYVPAELCNRHQNSSAIDPATGLQPSHPQVYHNFSSEGVPALGDCTACRLRLERDSGYNNWNSIIAREEQESNQWRQPSLKKFLEEDSPLPLFHLLNGTYGHVDPIKNPDYFAALRALWVKHYKIALRYLFRMSKVDIQQAQDHAKSLLLSTLQGAQASITGPAKSKTSTSRKAPSHLPTQLPESSIPAARIPPITNTQPFSNPPTQTPPVKKAKLSGANDASISDNDSEDDDCGEEGDTSSYDVSFIVNSKIQGRKRKTIYLIRWSGYTQKDDTWVPSEKMNDCQDLLRQYEQRARNDIQYGSLQQSQSSLSSLSFCFTTDAINAMRLQSSRFRDHISANRFQNSNTNDIILHASQLSRFNHHATQHSDIPQFLATHVISSLFKAHEAFKTSVTSSAQTLAIYQAVGRTYLFLYNWYANYGPAFCKALFQAYDEETLSSIFPSYAYLVQTLISRVQKLHQQGERSNPISVDLDTAQLSKCIPDITSYGTTVELKFTYKFPARHLTGISRSCLQSAIISFLTGYLIPGPKDESDDDKAQRQDEWLVKGAVVDALVDTFDGDGVLCAESVATFLEGSPWRLCGSGDTRVGRVAKQLRNPSKAAACIEPLRAFLSSQPSLPVVQEEANLLASRVHAVLQIPSKSSGALHRRNNALHSHNNLPKSYYFSQVEPPHVPENTFLAHLCPHEGRPLISFLALMLRETLDFCKVPKGRGYIKELRAILECTRPITSSTIVQNPDHCNPVRYNNHFQTLLKDNLKSCGHPLSSRFGLSNILVRILTGQGYRTQNFLGQYLNRWVESANQCISIYQSYINTAPPGSSNSNSRHCDPNCWGQHCDHFSVTLDNVGEFFPPLFSQDVLDGWRKLLGSYFDQPHPFEVLSDLQEDYPSYSQVLELLKSLEIYGAGEKSITAMQIANFLAIEGLCHPPSVEDMGLQVKKGSLAGLQILGFHVVKSKSGEADRKAAFDWVYNILDSQLDEEDKDALGFSVIFVEHLLCKVSRWYNILRDNKALDYVYGLMKDLQQEDNTLPIRPSISRAKLQEMSEARMDTT